MLIRCLIIAVIISVSVADAQPVVLIDNTNCDADGDPYPCCDGLNSGTCDGKVASLKVMRRHVMIEICRGFWSISCADTTFDTDGDGAGDQWLVEADTCTQGEADINLLLETKTVTCNASRVNNLECRDNDTSGGFLNSTRMPELQACRKAYKFWRDFNEVQRGRNDGRRVWRTLDASVNDDNDPVEARKLLTLPPIVLAGKDRG